MTATTGSATCLLLLGDRVVLRANGPPEAEYAMFEIGEIELRASEPGRVREHGYQTTAELARSRLANFGITSAVARELTVAMHPVIADAYARGAAVRQVSRYLGPQELFQSKAYDSAQRAYQGVFLELAALARDLNVEHAGCTLQALYLATILETEPDDTTLLLSTDACTKGGKPGARTFKRPSFADIQRLANALGGLAHKAPKPVIQEELPRADVVAFLRARAEVAPDEDARALYKSLEGTLAVRDMPDKGPLASPDLWAIEMRIESGELEGTLDQIDEVERRIGRTPGTTYLRARVSLAMRLEPAKLIAERVSALALSMTSFQELALLAADAWLEAGDPRRALPYARDLVDAPGVDAGLLLRAQRLLARASTTAPQKRKQTLVDSRQPAPQPSRPPAEMFEVDVAPLAPADVTGTLPSGTPQPVLPSLDPMDLAAVLPAPPPAPRLSIPAPPVPPPPVRPSRGVPPPVPSARPSRAPPLPSSGRLPFVAPLPPPEPVSGRRLPAAPPLPLPPEPRSSRKLPAVAPIPPPSDRDPLPKPRAPSLVPSVRSPFDSGEDTPKELSVAPRRSKRPAAAEVLPHAPPPPLELELPPPNPLASFTFDLPGPEPAPVASPVVSSPPPVMSSPAPDQPRPPRKPRLSGVMMETRPPTFFDPRAEPDSPVIPRGASPPSPEVVRTPLPEPRPAPARRAPIAAQTPPEEKPSRDKSAHERPTPMRPPSNETRSLSIPRLAETAPLELVPSPTPAPVAPSVFPPEAREYMHGASLPPYRHENPPPLLPKAPLLPKLGGTADELAEHLTLPPGLGGEPRSLDVLPTSVLEARVQFTLLARELGLDYRLKRGIDLRTDVSGIEAMQSVLLESFPDRCVKTSDEAYELRRHGALLSEILARRLDAEWLDISPNELGYWVMIVPPDTRVWPFGRVARLVAMGHKERDLVSYYFELQSRARGR